MKTNGFRLTIRKSMCTYVGAGDRILTIFRSRGRKEISLIQKERKKVTWDMGIILKTNEVTSLHMYFGYQVKRTRGKRLREALKRAEMPHLGYSRLPD